MDLINYLNILNYVALVILGVSAILFSYRIIFIFFAFKKDKPLKDTKKLGKFAILIPARNESAVIDKLFKSIVNQKYNKNKFDVYVITETEEDPTNEIAKSYGFNYFVRKDLENKRTKGYALDECIKYIYSKKIYYDAYFIIDADNEIEDNYLFEMNKVYQSGIEVGMSYKNVSNANDNWVSSCSSLLFSNINTFQNKGRNKLLKSMIISGTGFFISHKIIDKLKGFPFTSLTEDFEFTNYILLNKVKVKYIETTQVLVEQPTSLKTVNKQRVRWCKGYFNVNKQYSKQTFKGLFNKNSNKLGLLECKLSLIPNVFFIVSSILFLMALLTLITFSIILKDIYCFRNCVNLLFKFLLIYQLVLSLYTLLQLIAERDKIQLTKKQAIKCILLNPFFINLFVFHAVKALLSKNVEWKQIERKANFNIQEEAIINLEEEILLEKNNG